MKHNHQTVLVNKSKQTGTTLLEVVVSMFVVAFGLLAFISLQLKTQTSIRESYYLTEVATATENLVEKMLANPVVVVSDDEDLASYRSYEHYVDVSGNQKCGTGKSAEDRACEQVKSFKDGLTHQLRHADVKIKVCPKTEFFTSAPPSKVSDIKDFLKCAPEENGKHGSLVKVAWFFYDSNIEDNTDLLVDGDDSRIVYTYQMEVTQ